MAHHVVSPEQLLADPPDARTADLIRTAWAHCDHTTQFLLGVIAALEIELGESDGPELAILREAAARMANVEAKEMAL